MYKEPYRLKYSCSTHPRNAYMQLLSETGLLGFIFIICLFCYHALILFKIFFNKYIFNNQNNNSLTCIYILIFINLWPIAPSGSFITIEFYNVLYTFECFYFINHMKNIIIITIK